MDFSLSLHWQVSGRKWTISKGKFIVTSCVQVYLTQSDTTVAANVYLWADEMEKLEENKNWSFSHFEINRLQDWLDLFDGMKMVG